MEKRNVKTKNKELFIVIKSARTNPVQRIETMANDLYKSEHVSPIDACTCTGNCQNIK